jgi:hypothetical protein
MVSGMKSLATPVRKGKATMTITPAPKTFTDKNLDPKMSPAAGNKVSSDAAKPGGSISPELNAPKQTSSKSSGIVTT